MAEDMNKGTNLQAGVRLVALNLPEDEGAGIGFRLTRTVFDPYPWVREVVGGSMADEAGLRIGDCLLQADGKDLLGMAVGQVAGLIRGDGSSRGVTLLVWNCGVDPSEDPELLWSCGGGLRGERARRALSGAVRALACSVCGSTVVGGLGCGRSHLYCEGCWSRLERCALCREQLPAKDSPYAKNLVAQQVFEAIAKEYEIKDAIKKPKSVSAYSSPNRSPTMSPATSRKEEYHLSMMNRRHSRTNHNSDPNIHKSIQNPPINRQLPIPTNSIETETGNTVRSKCHCQRQADSHENIRKINLGSKTCSGNVIQHKLVTRLRQACSMVDLQNSDVQSCLLSRSLNNIDLSGKCSGDQQQHSSSLEDLKKPNCQSTCGSIDLPVLLLTPPQIYVVSCEHEQ